MIKQRWSSQLNFILVTAGAAVGLGPIWKFPYMAGENGGGAFVLISFLAMFFIGVPIMLGEISLGKIARANPVASMRILAEQNNLSKKWTLLGWWGALALILVLSFYSVIAGWSIAYIFKLWTGQLHGKSAVEILQLWNNFLNNPLELMFWHTVFMFCTMYVVSRGVNQGLEKASKIMMPGLFLVLLILMLYSATIGDFARAWRFLFTPDFSKLTPLVALNALGQAAFALAIGAGCMLTYGCYVPSEAKLSKDCLLIASMLIVSSIISGLAMFPLVFAYNLPVAGGPGLMFTVLPIAFNAMPFGLLFGGLFFIMLWFAAWTSSISMAEPLIVILDGEFKSTRGKSAVIIGCIAWTIGTITLLSFNILRGSNIFDYIADFATNIILPTGGLAFAIFAGWKMPAQIMQTTMNIQSQPSFKAWQVLIKYLAPVGILSVFITGLI